jgi:hypothetical protein
MKEGGEDAEVKSWIQVDESCLLPVMRGKIEPNKMAKESL